MVAERNLLTRLPGRGIGFLLHAVDQLLHADAEPDIELAGFLQNGLAEIVSVQFLLADLEDAGLAVGKRQQAQRRVLNGPHRRGLGQSFQARLHARLRGAEVPAGGFEHLALLLDSAAIMSNAIRLPLAAMSASRSAVLCARLASLCEKVGAA